MREAASFLPADWSLVAPLLDRLLDTAPSERAQVIAELAGDDTERRRVLQQLLAECERGMPFLEDSASERFAELARAEDEEITLPGLLGDRYRVGAEIGRGGMARVFLGEDIRHGRAVAVKVIRPELAASLGRGRFLREIEMVARLRHPNIMPLFDSGEAEGLLYYVMPYEPGKSLKARLADGPPMPLAEGISLLRDVARALSHAHGEGLVHRDIKPANVMLSGDAAVVADFGLAKAVSIAHDGEATFAGSMVGTPAYMAPEQASGSAVIDHRADLYAFGCLAHVVLTGTPPFAGSAKQVVAAHLTAPAPSLVSRRSDVPPAVARIIDQCLCKSPDERPSNARVVLDALSGDAGVGGHVKPWSRVALVGGGVGLLAVAAWALANRNTLRPTSAMASAPAIAVLPFTNATRDSTLTYIATALPAFVSDRLGDPDDVVSFAATSDLATSPDSVRRTSLAAAGVRTMVDGSIGATADSVVADVRVRDVHSGREAYRVRAAAGSLQFAALVAIVIDSLRQHLRVSPSVAVYVPDPEAARLVGEAQYLGTGPGPASRTFELLREASERDPGWYRPYLGLSDYLGATTADGAGTRADPTQVAAAIDYATRALERARSDAARAAALIRRALPRWIAGDRTAALLDAQLAASLDSTDADTQRLIGAWWRYNANLDSAWKYKSRSQRLAPWNPAELVGLAALHRCARNSDDEMRLFRRAEQLGLPRPARLQLAGLLAAKGDYDEAFEQWRRGSPPARVQKVLEQVSAAKGEARWRAVWREDAEAALALLRSRRDVRRDYMDWIEAFEGTGQRDSAVAVLGEWIASRAPKISLQRFCVYPLDAFRRDARVQSLVRASHWPLAEFDTALVWHPPEETR